MQTQKLLTDYFVPQHYPQKMIGKFTYKVIQKRDYVRTDGTCALYIQMYMDGDRKRLPLELSVKSKEWNKEKQRVRSNSTFAKEYNLIIEKWLAEINRIQIDYRLTDQKLTLELLLEELKQPTFRIDFNVFAADELEKQKEYLRPGTYRQQKGALAKIKRFRSPLYFKDIDDELIKELRGWCRKQNNKPATVESTVKNLKKYIHAAQNKGIRMDLDFSEIKVKKVKGDRTFLLPQELRTLVDFYENKFITTTHRNILSRYLFSCFTGLRISDIENVKIQNFVGDYLAFTMVKTEKFISLKLNKSAMRFIELPHLWEGSYSREHINRELKRIAAICGINKVLYYHSSRHTFATNFLIAGGRVENLQHLLGHSDITETMTYVHIVKHIKDDQITLMDDILKD